MSDLEKWRSIGHVGRMRGKGRVRELVSDDDGATTGYEIDLADGRQEAVVRPQPIRVTSSISTNEVHVDG